MKLLFFTFLLAILPCGVASAQHSSQHKAPASALPPCPHSFITAALLDSSGFLWAATEGGGLLRLAPSGSDWERIYGGDGLPQSPNFYALAEDLQGRIWAGTGNQGLAVWNGREWKRYDQENALPGERIFDIKVSPANGDVAIATSGGLTIYSPQSKTWKDLTRNEGLAEDQIVSMDFTDGGTLWVAHPCGGVACSSPADGYSSWKKTTTKWFWDASQYIRQPLANNGSGLPSNLCNAIAVQGDAVWVGTNSGLAANRGGRQWNFARGKDAQAKNKGLFGGDPSARAKLSAAARPDAPDLLPEDYVTCLYPSPEGIWIGFREKGVALMHPVTMKLAMFEAGSKPRLKENSPEAFVTCFVSLPDGSLYAGTYGAGFKAIGRSTAKPLKPRLPKNGIGFPAEPPAPADRELEELGQNLSAPTSPNKRFGAWFWYEDWATQGDWCERYGRAYAMLCAVNAPWGNMSFDITGMNKTYDFQAVGLMGPHRAAKDDLRHWVHWIDKPDNRNVVYNPESGTRTEAEWDDHGEAYARSFDGPDVWAIVLVPEGRHLMSLYFYNPNGHELNPSCRDYLVEIRKWASKLPKNVILGRKFKSDYNLPSDCIWRELPQVMKTPVLARCRVKDFSGGGVYKNFILEGPAYYYVRVCKNYSFNTILNAVFLSDLDETRNGKKERNGYGLLYGQNAPQPPPLDQIDTSALPPAAMRLWSQTLLIPSIPSSRLPCVRKTALLAYRNAAARQAPGPLLGAWRWHLRLWNAREKDEIAQAFKDSWASKQADDPFYRSKEWNPYGPGTVPFSIPELHWMDHFKIDWKNYSHTSPSKPQYSIKEMKKLIRKLYQEYKQQEQTPQ